MLMYFLFIYNHIRPIVTCSDEPGSSNFHTDHYNCGDGDPDDTHTRQAKKIVLSFILWYIFCRRKLVARFGSFTVIFLWFEGVPVSKPKGKGEEESAEAVRFNLRQEIFLVIKNSHARWEEENSVCFRIIFAMEKEWNGKWNHAHTHTHKRYVENSAPATVWQGK